MELPAPEIRPGPGLYSVRRHLIADGVCRFGNSYPTRLMEQLLYCEKLIHQANFVIFYT